MTPWIVIRQAPLSMGFARQKYWRRLLFPSPGDRPQPRIKLHLLHWQADSLPLSHQWNPLKFPSSISILISGTSSKKTQMETSSLPYTSKLPINLLSTPHLRKWHHDFPTSSDKKLGTVLAFPISTHFHGQVLSLDSPCTFTFLL